MDAVAAIVTMTKAQVEGCHARAPGPAGLLRQRGGAHVGLSNPVGHAAIDYYARSLVDYLEGVDAMSGVFLLYVCTPCMSLYKADFGWLAFMGPARRSSCTTAASCT